LGPDGLVPSFTVPPNCAICRGGWVYHGSEKMYYPDGQLNNKFGKAFPCACQKQTREEKRRAALMKYCALPDDADNKTLANFDIKPENTEMVAAATEVIAGKVIFLTLSGVVNTGKTHLAISVCHEWLNAGIPAKFYQCGQFLRDLRDCFDEDARYKYREVFERACTVPLLVLDDFYQGKRSEWAEGELEGLVDARYLKKLPTVFTTNVPLSAMSERIASRLQRESWCRVVVLQ